MNVFGEVSYSFCGVGKYPEFLKNKKGKVFGYVVWVVFLFTLISHLFTIPNVKVFVEEAKEAVRELPDFSMNDGRLQATESYYYDEDGMMIIVETGYGAYINQYQTSDWYEILEDYEVAVIMDETTILLKSDESIDIYDYPESISLKKADIYDWIDYVYILVAIYLVFAYLFSLAGYFLSALLVALMGMMISSFMNKRMTFGQLYLLSLYAKTLPYLLKGILKLLNISFFGYFVVTFVIAGLYLGFALRRINEQEEEQNRMQGPFVY